MNRYEKIGFAICVVLFLVNSLVLVCLSSSTNKTFKENVKLREFIEEPIVIDETTENTEEAPNLPEKTERMIKVEELKKINNDIVGWLEIPNSEISYPVLQSSDNSYYMNHNYKKEYSKEGSIFLDKDYDWTSPSTNLLIYGHNNRGTNLMFCGLMDYKDQNYYNSHQKIRFTTVEEDSEYQIISVFLSRVYYKSENNFRYYYFINSENKEEFDEYIQNCKALSLYDTGVTSEYGDSLITLSTCEFSQKDGRLAIVGKKIKQEP